VLIPQTRPYVKTILPAGRSGPSINRDGALPLDALVLSDNTLYGTTSYGGGAGIATVFAVRTNGNGFTVLHSFTAIDPPTLANSDGGIPMAGLILWGDALYGPDARPRPGTRIDGTVGAHSRIQETVTCLVTSQHPKYPVCK
jgi:uncharacterized repeat protein (TIGR03803 family)